MRRLTAILALGLLLFTVWMGPAVAGEGSGYRDVSAIDNVFGPRIVRIPVGGEIDWTNDGRSVHDVVADDGSFRSPDLQPGDDFVRTFDRAGVYPYHCSYHGAPGVGMSGIVVVGDVPLPGSAGGVGAGREAPPSVPAGTVRVPRDYPTIQEAVDHAEPGGLVLVSPGVYREAVVVTMPFVTIRGTDRNRVILDGGFELDNGIQVIEADGVSIENMTARHYVLNGFFWSGVFGYRGSYLTAYGDGDYGIFAYDSAFGQFDHSYASGHPDSGFYIGQCDPCHAVVTDVLAEHNALGFSGTNASGDIFIVNSEWRDNMAGIVPNTLDSEELPPQRDMVIAGNWVHDNDDPGAPAKPLQYPSLGFGIILNGTRDDLVTQNLVEGHEAFGIAVLPSPDRNFWTTSGNEIRDNLVRDSGRADLALGAPSAGGDCFAGNDYRTSAPAAIELLYGCGPTPNPAGGGELGVALGPLVRFLEARAGRIDVGDWRTAPAPSPQPQMPGAAQAPPRPAIPRDEPGGNVPAPFTIRDARTMADRVHATDDVRREVTVLGFPLATTWWGLLIGLYGYVLPIVLYSAWVSIALWDLVRQEAVPNRTRIAWMAVILLVPLLGPIAYYVLGRSPIQRSLRWMLVAGGLGVYLLLALVGVLAGAG
jgi:plastocyanin